MAGHTLEDRVTALERELAKLRSTMANGVRPKDWRRTIGMFTGDDVMKRIVEEARKIREADRARAEKTSGEEVMRRLQLTIK